MREQRARAAHAGLHLVEDEQQTVAVAQLAQRPQELDRRDVDAALALHRLDHDRGRLRPDRLLDRGEIGERHVVEAFDRRPEALEVFRVAAGGDGRERAAVEGAFEGDDAPALGPAADIMVAPRRLDRGLARFGARIAEEDPVGERRRDQSLGELLLARDPIEVGRVPELLGLVGEGRDELGVGVAERIDRDARGKVEVALAIRGDEPAAFPALEDEVLARVGRHHRG